MNDRPNIGTDDQTSERSTAAALHAMGLQLADLCIAAHRLIGEQPGDNGTDAAVRGDREMEEAIDYLLTSPPEELIAEPFFATVLRIFREIPPAMWNALRAEAAKRQSL